MIIKAPSRIHMSLIDLNGSYRRIDGGIGLALSEPQFILEKKKRDDKMVTLEFSDDVDDQADRSGICAHNKKLHAENDAANHLAQEQRPIRFYLI